jgi:predicted outer membrane protein
MSQGTQTVEVAKPAMVSQGTQTIEQALRATISRGTQTQYAKPATSQEIQTTKLTMVSQGTQTDEIASVEMNPAVKGEKEQDWEDLDLEVPVEDTVEDDDWEIVDA